MNTLMGKAIFEITLIEATVLSVLMALGMSWLGLRFFFRMLVGATAVETVVRRPATHHAVPIKTFL